MAVLWEIGIKEEGAVGDEKEREKKWERDIEERGSRIGVASRIKNHVSY